MAKTLEYEPTGIRLRPNRFPTWSLFLMIPVLALMLGTCSTQSLDSGMGGVLWDRFSGTRVDNIYPEGTHFVAPWNRLYTYDLRTQEKKETISVLSANGLEISLELSIRYRPDPATLGRLHTEYGQGYYDILLAPVIRSEVREVIGKYTPEQLYSTERTTIQKEINDGMMRNLKGRHILLEGIFLRDVQLPPQIKTAIEEKLKEEQSAQQYEFRIQKEAKEAERKAIEARGIAEYQRIVSQGLTPQLLTWKGIEATETLAKSPNAKVVIIGNERGGGLPMILGGQ